MRVSWVTKSMIIASTSNSPFQKLHFALSISNTCSYALSTYRVVVFEIYVIIEHVHVLFLPIIIIEYGATFFLKINQQEPNKY
jgi:hypothetical protein